MKTELRLPVPDMKSEVRKRKCRVSTSFGVISITRAKALWLLSTCEYDLIVATLQDDELILEYGLEKSEIS